MKKLIAIICFVPLACIAQVGVNQGNSGPQFAPIPSGSATTINGANITGAHSIPDSTLSTNVDLLSTASTNSGIETFLAGIAITASPGVLMNNVTPNGSGDNGLILFNNSTNFISNSGFGEALEGSGTSGAANLGTTQGPTFGYIGTNKADTFINGGSSIVMNYDSKISRFFAVCSPGGGNAGASDSGNYAGFFDDWEHHLFRVPLIPQGTTNGGCYQPDSTVWDVTATPPAVGPAFASDGYIDSNGKVFTSLSNNAAKTHLFFTSSSLTSPVASGTLTRISSPGTGDASITYSAIAANRTYVGDAFTVDQSTGKVGVKDTLTSSNFFTSVKAIQDNASTNWNPFSTTNEVTFQDSIGNGLALGKTSGQNYFYVGYNNNPMMSLSTGIWLTGPSIDIGGTELGAAANTGTAVLGVHGSISLNATNTAIGYTNSTLFDSTVVMNASGILSNVLLRADSHSLGRIQIAKNAGTTNEVVAYPAGQGTIDGLTTYTNAPGGCIGVQSDGTTGRILWKYSGNPTNFIAVTATGITNTWNWPAHAYLLGTAVTYTNFDNSGAAYMTNTTLINTVQTIYMQPGAKITAASGLSGTMHAD